MKTKILQENFNKALNLASHFVSSRAQLPILSNIVIRAEKNKLKLLATNLEISISTSIGAKTDEEGEIAIPAKTISDLVANLPKGQMSLSSQAEQLKIESENFDTTLVGMNASDFPSIPQEITEPEVIISRVDFVKALGQVLFATSTDETRPIITGALFIFDKQKFSIVGTDGFRLSKKDLDIKQTIDNKKIILPRNSLTELIRVAGESEEIAIKTLPNENQVVFSTGSGSFESIVSSRIIEGEFPPYEKIIPTSSRVSINCDRLELLRAIKASIVIARDSAYVGKLKVEDNRLTISTESSHSGSQKTSIDAKVEGGEVEILYNLHFMEEFLNNSSGNDVLVKLTDSTSPGAFHDATDLNFLHLIMPVKL